MSYKTIGQTKALIPEAGTASKSKWTQDGKSGDTRFPYGQFKAIATVGEVDASSGDVLTGYPDGQAAWLKNDKTIRVAYQSESYGKVNGMRLLMLRPIRRKWPLERHLLAQRFTI